jgi:hypothetical protein
MRNAVRLLDQWTDMVGEQYGFTKSVDNVDER